MADRVDIKNFLSIVDSVFFLCLPAPLISALDGNLILENILALISSMYHVVLLVFHNFFY